MNGNNIIVYKDGTAIAGAKSAEISTSVGTIEVASATSGQWREFITGRKEWSLSCGYLITANSGVRDLLTVGTTCTIKVKGRGAADSTGVSGSAIITKCNITASRGNLVQGSFQFQGSGQLT